MFAASGYVSLLPIASNAIFTKKMLNFFLLLLLVSVPLYANPRFHDATQEAGIDFVHVNGANGQKFVIETVGPGGGFFDYDGDGRLDIYLINGAAVPGTEYDPAPQNALYRNRGDGTFADVTSSVQVGDTGYGMAVRSATTTTTATSICT